MISDTAALRDTTRRHFFSQCGMGIGSVALASLMAERGLHAASAAAAGPGVMKKANVTPRAKNVIYLFMAGGPSQLELYDYKPKLVELNAQPIPQSYIEGKRFAFMGSSNGFNLLGTRRSFKQHGQSGAWVSDMLPYTSGVVDDLSIVTTCKTELFNHAPAKLFMNTGSGSSGGRRWVPGSRTALVANRAICRASSCCKAARVVRVAVRCCGVAAFCRRPIKACRCVARVSRF